jgi:hypothetical protein
MRKPTFGLATWTAFLIFAAFGSASAQLPEHNPSPAAYVQRVGGGATLVQSGQLVLDGHRLNCRASPTVLDPNLNDYAASYPQFVILNMSHIRKVSTPVKLWIYTHECGHLFGGRDEAKADCFAVRRGRAAGWLKPEGLQQVCEFIKAANADAMHLAGPDRCTMMQACWRQAPKPRANP